MDLPDASTVEARVPGIDAPKTFDALAATPWGTAILPGAFTVVSVDDFDAFDLHGATPASGKTTGGEQVLLAVTGVQINDDIQITFGGVPTDILSWNPAEGWIRVTTPASETPGPVDITLHRGAEARILEAAYHYVISPVVTDIEPSVAPESGGGEVRITGAGFTTNSQVWIGAMAATNVQQLSDTELLAVVPPGSAGTVDVIIRNGEEEGRLVGGFRYEGPLDAWALTPNSGSTSGGTLVTLFGSGFSEGVDVFFGESPSPEIIVISPTHLLARTPPGQLGVTDVAITMKDSAGSPIWATLSNGYTYMDPTGAGGGTWGARIDNNLDISVVEGFTGVPVPEAFVVLGSDPATQRVGITNAAGQITFGVQGLKGPQTITATHKGYEAESIVGFDARHATLVLDRENECSEDFNFDCDVGWASFEGQITNPYKGVTVPYAPCEEGEAEAENHPLCAACETNADCAGMNCSTMPYDGATFCTNDCASAADCPDEYTCLPIEGNASWQCVPSAGTPLTICMSSNNGENPANTEADGKISMLVAMGNFAIVCWSGLMKHNVFTANRMGALRGLEAIEEGQVVTGNVVLDNAIDARFEIDIDRSPEGDDTKIITDLEVHMDLGADGSVLIERFPEKMGRDPYVLSLPREMTGSLYDVTFDATASMTHTDIAEGQSVTYERAIESFGHTHALHLQDDTIDVVETGLAHTIHGIAATDERVLAVGDDGLVVQSYADTWSWHATQTDSDLYAIDSLADGQAIAVGASGVATHFDGIGWSTRPLADTRDFTGVWMATAEHAFAAGGQIVSRFDGDDWTIDHTADVRLRDVTGIQRESGFAVLVVGDSGYAALKQGGTWLPVPLAATSDLSAVWAFEGSDGMTAIAVGLDGTVHHFEGAQWHSGEKLSIHALRDVWGPSPEEVYAVGDRGVIFRFNGIGWEDLSHTDYRSTLLAVGGHTSQIWAMGRHDFVMGPMLSIPENFTPTIMSDNPEDHKLTEEYKFHVDTYGDANFTKITATSSKFCTVEACGMQGMITLTEDGWTTWADPELRQITLPRLRELTSNTNVEAGEKSIVLTRVDVRPDFTLDGFQKNETQGGSWKSWVTISTSAIR